MNLHSLFNILLLFYLASFPLLLYLNKHHLKGKNKRFNKALKYGRKIHPYAGITLILSGFLHGYLKMGGRLVFHTGTILLFALAVNAFLGFYYKKTRNKRFAFLHRIVGIVSVVLFLLHYINPWLLS